MDFLLGKKFVGVYASNSCLGTSIVELGMSEEVFGDDGGWRILLEMRKGEREGTIQDR